MTTKLQKKPRSRRQRGVHSRVLYVRAAGRYEQVEFQLDASVEEMRDLFLTALEASTKEILKLYTSTGKLMRITNQLPANTPSSRYRLEIAAVPSVGDIVNSSMGFDINAFEKRIDRAERMMLILTDGIKDDTADFVDTVAAIRLKTNRLVNRILSRPHLRWLGFAKQVLYFRPPSDVRDVTLPAADWNQARCDRVCATYRDYRSCKLSFDVAEMLKQPSFDNWQWEDHELMLLMRSMYVELNLVETFYLDLRVLDEWLCSIYRSYNIVPFHNFSHCFCVTQMTYAIIWGLELTNVLEEIDLLTLLVAATCHDMDHPGFNNAFQINAGTHLAMLYNDVAPLENHHCSSTFSIINNLATNPFRNLTPEQFKRFREGIVKCIMATDMGRHNEFVKNFRAVIPAFDISEKDHRELLLQIIIKIADISNEARPDEVSLPWLNRLFEEFSLQFAREAHIGVTQTPFMDISRVSKPSAQIGFIKFVQLPLYQSLADVYPSFVELLVDPIRRALDYWTQMEKVVRTSQGTVDRIAKINAAIADMKSFDVSFEQVLLRPNKY